jgi:hypothetical protein
MIRLRSNSFVFAVLFNDHVYREPKLRKLLEKEVLTGGFRARYLRRCEQLHKRWRNRERLADSVASTMALGSGIAMRGKSSAIGRANPLQAASMFSPNFRFLLSERLPDRWPAEMTEGCSREP